MKQCSTWNILSVDPKTERCSTWNTAVLAPPHTVSTRSFSPYHIARDKQELEFVAAERRF